MKRKPMSIAVFMAIAAGVAVLGIVRLNSTGADVQPQQTVGQTDQSVSGLAGAQPSQTPVPEPTGSVFGEHSYELSPQWVFAQPAEESKAPEISREEIIATTTSMIEGSGEQGNNSVLASVDLVQIAGSPLAEQPPGLFWLVVVENAAVKPGGLGGPLPETNEPCDEPIEMHRPQCLPDDYRMIGTAMWLYEADTGEMFAYEFDPTE